MLASVSVLFIFSSRFPLSVAKAIKMSEEFLKLLKYDFRVQLCNGIILNENNFSFLLLFVYLRFMFFVVTVHTFR